MGRTLIEAVEEVGEVFIHTERLKKKVVSISRQHVDRYIIYLLSFMLSSLVGVSRMLHNEQRGQFPSRQPPHTKQFHSKYTLDVYTMNNTNICQESTAAPRRPHHPQRSVAARKARKTKKNKVSRVSYTVLVSIADGYLASSGQRGQEEGQQNTLNPDQQQIHLLDARLWSLPCRKESCQEEEAAPSK